MSGSTSGNGQISFFGLNYGGGSPFALPFSVFVPTAWGSGAAGNPVTPSYLASQSAALQMTVNNSIATVANLGAFQFGSAQSLFQQWGSNLGEVNLISANALKSAVAKSAHGCSGFLSCFFG